jgi:hypothetical protein
MSNWYFILCKRTLQKLISVIGITFQMHEREFHTMSFVVAHEFPNAHIFLQSQWLWTQPSEMASSLAISISFLIRSSAWHTLSSIVDVLQCLGCRLLSTFALQLWRALCHFYTSVCDIMCSVYHSNDWELIPTEVTPSLSKQNESDYILRHLNVFLVGLPSLNCLHGDTMCSALSWLYNDTDDLLVPITWWNLQWSDVILHETGCYLIFFKCPCVYIVITVKVWCSDMRIWNPWLRM